LNASRTPLVVATAIVLLLLAAVVVPVGSMFLTQSTERGQALAELAAYRAKIAAAPRLRATADAVARQESDAGMLIAGASTSLAAANMQNTIFEIVQRHGGQLRSSQVLESTVAKGLARILVHYEVSLPPGSLLAATYELETRTPFLFVDAAEIRPELYGNASSGPPTSLHVSWTVHAYRKADAP
jgi:hypothetical protein